MKMKLSPTNLPRVFTSCPSPNHKQKGMFLFIYLFFPQLRNSYGFMCNFRYKVAPLPT